MGHEMTEEQQLEQKLEQQLLEMIAMIQRDYQKQIQPYVDGLVLLRSRQPLPPIYISLEQAEKLGLNIEHLHGPNV
jgi:hypothetical protein